jgi:hypothetical protein
MMCYRYAFTVIHRTMWRHEEAVRHQSALLCPCTGTQEIYRANAGIYSRPGDTNIARDFIIQTLERSLIERATMSTVQKTASCINGMFVMLGISDLACFPLLQRQKAGARVLHRMSR